MSNAPELIQTMIPATEADLDETVAQVTALGRRAYKSVVDLRDGAAVRSCIDAHVGAAGRLDVIVVNAGVAFFRPFLDSCVRVSACG